MARLLKELNCNRMYKTSLLAFNLADYTIIGVIITSIAISLVRGLMREALSLATWIVAFWVGFKFHSALASFVGNYIHTPSLVLIASFILLFVGVLALGCLVNFLFDHLLKKTGLTGADRFFGIFFGCARGMLLIAIAILLGEMTAFVREQWWQGSVLIPHFQWLVDWLRGFLPTQLDNLKAINN